MLVDLRHLLRNLRRSPGSAIAAFLTLSLTLGAGASIFAVLDAVVLVISGVGAVLPAALRAAHTDPLIALIAE